MATPSNPGHLAELYWNSAAETYEQDFSGTTVGKIRRGTVRKALDRTFQPGHRVLELCCGTGIDAVSLARRGVHVVACDISPRMIELARAHAAGEGVSPPPDFRVLAAEHLSSLTAEDLFDGAFSNFSGLNCVANLHDVSEDLGPLLKPKASLVICMMGRFVPLEILWFLAQGKPKRAFRRLLTSQTYSPTRGLIIRRPTVTQIESQMRPAFRLVRWTGIGIVVPPSYAESFAMRLPRLIRVLATIDRRIGSLPLFRNMADCVLLEFERE
ncbi:class I SAM-dependent methyltransferase [Granulicella sibirica]|uniref:SAM-dependent methyltransferase n=1 Tax=Granulicella sibirica TaxID=2479048 RepID=A0A4Q0STB7_9BACT|nr:class I SAM-dependent methyltransferase [Granulicella sibirica]RXH54183.1 SAM-dependent methyltransferase [Granulicella sibirica]